jgi:hypothetical protein
MMADHACLLQDNAEIKSFITAASSCADLIINAAAIIWDELCMANVAAFEAVHNICCELKNSTKPFGGIPFVGAGDFRQIAPVVTVVKGVGPSVSFDACIKSSPLWKSFRVFSLHQPIRSAGDPEYTTFIDNIGENTDTDRVSVGFLRTTIAIDDAIQFLYPLHVLTDPESCLKRAFLSPRNIYMDEFNNTILDMLPGPSSEFLDCVQWTHFLAVDFTTFLRRNILQCGYGQRGGSRSF